MQRFKRLIKQLEQFNFSTKEAKIYLCMSELGPSTIQEIAKYSKINRSTTHLICDKLRKKGHISETRRGKKRLLFVEELDQFSKMLDHERFQLDMKEIALKGLISSLHTLHPSQKDSPRVRFYEGEQGFIDICQRSLDKATGEMLFISSMPDYYKVTTKKYGKEHYVPTRIEKNIWIKILAPEDDYTRQLKQTDKEELRETRFLPPNHPFKSTMFIYGNEFSLISSNAPFLGVVVESKELAQFMRQIFNLLWSFVGK